MGKKETNSNQKSKSSFKQEIQTILEKNTQHFNPKIIDIQIPKQPGTLIQFNY